MVLIGFFKIFLAWVLTSVHFRRNIGETKNLNIMENQFVIDYQKQSIITTILMLQDAIKNDYAKFTFNELINCEYDNLECIRDCKLKIYNDEKL